jgi:peptidoglycan/xylan/chitin deacetylase (PgdA/CDA1 family)
MTPMSVRSLVKGVAEAALTRSGASALARRSRRTGVIILAYHNIVPDGEPVSGELSLHLPQRQFGAQLDLLLRTHDIIPLEEIATARSGARPGAVITFDDACQGALTAGVDELARRSVPATVFVTPSFIGGGSFWWDAVRTAAGDSLSGADRDHALTRLAGRDPLVRGWALESGMRVVPVPVHQTGASEAQLLDAEQRGISFGGHSWSHPNLAVLEGKDLEMELEAPLRWLRERHARVIPWLAYPYGLASPATARAAQAAGYTGALRIDGGWLQGGPPADWFAVPRLNIPAGLSLRGFELKTSGITGGITGRG